MTETVITATTVYTYDNANRLTNVGAQAYTWDNNGNLLTDGVYTYTYNVANRPITITNGTTTNVFAYNGDGARLKQLVNGTPTTYTVDLAAGLTQVLVDVTSGVTNTYEYGNGRIAQNNSGGGTSYFLGDALGSVRQFTDSSGNVTLTKSYTPYGSVLSSSGSGFSSYGFTGEWTDNTGLVYLRARYYASGQGRFVTRDTWAGDYNRPLTLNGWNYTNGNPINYADPSGYCPILGKNSDECLTSTSGPAIGANGQPVAPIGLSYWLCKFFHDLEALLGSSQSNISPIATSQPNAPILQIKSSPKQGKITIPGGNWDWVADRFGINRHRMRDIIHGCKDGGIRGDDDLGVDLETGDIVDTRTGEIIGNVYYGC